jgi:hypothetical protein
MGFFNDFAKRVDKGLGAIESGALEKRLNQFADAVEKRSKQADSTMGKIADAPGTVLKKAEDKTKHISSQAQKSLDELRKKD